MTTKNTRFLISLFVWQCWLLCHVVSVPAQNPASTTPRFILYPAPELWMPGAREFDVEWGVDGNSPVERDSLGRLVIFNSLQYPWRSVGEHLWQMQPAERTTILNRTDIPGGLWLEATYRDVDGTLFGWFHNEIEIGCENTFLRAPQIRQMVSYDEGVTWEDQGVILTAPEESFYCGTSNFFFAGGNGDFSALYDPVTQCFYFYFSTYHREFAEQGIACARLKWDGQGWSEPGLGGRGKVLFPAQSDWHLENANALWGPALHYNTYLRQYVMLLNHAVNTRWETEGFYMCFNPDLSNPGGWSPPERLPIELTSPAQAYPQVIGLDPGDTDKRVGRIARLFVSGQSFWEIQFGEPFAKPARRANLGTPRYPTRTP
jgi:hypothetical protein